MEQVTQYIFSLMPLCWLVLAVTYLAVRREPVKARVKR